MTGHEPPPELKEDAHRKPIFARSCRSAQSGCPTAPREVHLPLLPHGPSGVHRHLPRRTRLRRSAGLEENRPVPFVLFPRGTRLLYSPHREKSSKMPFFSCNLSRLLLIWNETSSTQIYSRRN